MDIYRSQRVCEADAAITAGRSKAGSRIEGYRNNEASASA